MSFPYAAFENMQSAPGLSPLFGFSPTNNRQVRVGGKLVFLKGEAVTGKYFDGLGLSPERGRLLGATDAKGSAVPALVISDELWTRLYARSPGVVGQTLDFHHVPYTIVGVAPVQFGGMTLGQPVDFWVPLERWDETQSLRFDRTNWGVTLVGRLASRADPDHVKNELNGRFQESLAGLSPSGATKAILPQLITTSGYRGVDLLGEALHRPIQAVIILTVILIMGSLANVTLLLINRALTRRRELAMRLSLGATWSVLLQDALYESSTISLVGAVLGIIAATVSSRFLLDVLTSLQVSTGFSLALARPNPVMYELAFGVMLLSGLVTGTIGAFSVKDSNMLCLLKRDRHIHGGSQTWGFRSATIAALSASSVAMIIIATLLIATLRNLKHQDLGFEPSSVVVVPLEARSLGYRGASLISLYSTICTRLSQIPGISRVSASSNTLLSTTEFALPLSLPNRPTLPRLSVVIIDLVGANHFRTMGIPMIDGNTFASEDTDSSNHQVVINSALAKALPRDDRRPGAVLMLGGERFTVSGVVGDVKGGDLRKASLPRVYVPYSAQPIMMAALPDGLSLEIRSSEPLKLLRTQIQKIIKQTDSRLPNITMTTESEQIGAVLAPERTLAQMSLLFTGIILLLTGVSVYAVQASSVGERRSEFSVRMALGSSGRDLIWSVLRRSFLVASPGIILGVLIGFIVSHSLSSLWYGVGATDGTSYILAVSAVVIVILAGTIAPALRGARVDPGQALREQ